MSTAITQRSAVLSGIGALLFGLALLTGQDVVMKNLSNAGYSVFQLLFLRTMFTLLFLQGALVLLRAPNPRRTYRLGAQLLRGVFLFTALTCYYIALSVMSLLDVVAIFFAAPLIATLLSAWLLRESVGTRRWLAISVGFLGALVMVRPGEDTVQLASLIAVAAAIFYASAVVLTRYLGSTDSAATTSYYTVLTYLCLSALGTVAVEGVDVVQGGAFASLSLVRPWLDPSWSELGWLTAAGAAVAGGFFCLSQAYRFAPVSVLAPFEFVALVWAGIVGFWAWGEVPTSQSLLGAVLIVASGVYVSVSIPPPAEA